MKGHALPLWLELPGPVKERGRTKAGCH
jgi:hypothetical protein